MIFVLDKFLTDLNNLFFLKAAIAIIAPIPKLPKVLIVLKFKFKLSFRK
jgi:hypothetical protein|tara:strand:+ start:682 stop:828 length:147 start_codon:yes stop_codon:yes gene_type:complete